MQVPRSRVAIAFAQAWWQALGWTVALVLSVAIVGSLFAEYELSTVAWTAVVVTAVTRDIVSSRTFSRAHGVVVSVDEVHRLYAVPIVLDALTHAEIPAYPRTYAHRCLLQLFGPFVPVEIVVPNQYAEAAGRIVAAALDREPV
jgi:hypothetical protein